MLKRKTIDTVLDAVLSAGHTTSINIIDETKPDLKRLSIVYHEEDRIYANLIEILNFARLYAAP